MQMFQVLIFSEALKVIPYLCQLISFNFWRDWLLANQDIWLHTIQFTFHIRFNGCENVLVLAVALHALFDLLVVLGNRRSKKFHGGSLMQFLVKIVRDDVDSSYYFRNSGIILYILLNFFILIRNYSNFFFVCFILQIITNFFHNILLCIITEPFFN